MYHTTPAVSPGQIGREFTMTTAKASTDSTQMSGSAACACSNTPAQTSTLRSEWRTLLWALLVFAALFALPLGWLARRGLSTVSRVSGEEESDLLSYVLFDGSFAEKLIALGERDAIRRAEEIRAFFGVG